jgi:hypothetical protein
MSEFQAMTGGARNDKHSDVCDRQSTSNIRVTAKTDVEYATIVNLSTVTADAKALSI